MSLSNLFPPERNENDIILSDLDSTLCNTQHRFHLSPIKDPENGSWLKFSMACYDDPPIEGTLALLKILSLNYPLYFVSHRDVEAYQNTVAWFDLHELPFESIRLSRPSDSRHNGEYKVAYINQLREEGLNPVIMFEDYPDVAQMITAQTGVPTLCVNPMYEDSVMKKYAEMYEADNADIEKV